MLQKRLSALCAFIAIAVAACGGGTSNASFPNVPVNSGPSSQGTYGVSGPSGIQSSLTLSAAQASGTTKPTITVTSSSTAPSNAATLTSALRRTASTTRVGTQQASGDTSIIYYSISSNIAATVSGITGMGIVLPSAPPAGPILLAFYNGSQWVTIGSPATVSGDEITFGAATINPAFQIPAGGSLDLVVYTGNVLVTPTPEPPAPVASPSAVTIYVGTTSTVNVTTGPGTVITATSSTSSATVTPSVTANSSGVAAFTITAAASPGSALITFTDPLGRTQTTAVTVTNAPPTPLPSPAVATIAVGDPNTTAIVVSAASNDVINATSSDTSVATVTSQVKTSGTGSATFYVTAVAGGTTTISFTDANNLTGTLALTVSAVENGTFTNSTTGWTPCAYQHTTALLSAVNYSTPLPGTGPANSPSPEPYADQTQGPTVVNTAAPTGSAIIPLTVGTPPANDNPNVTAVSATAPPVLGSDVGLIGSLNGATQAYPAGETGICQTVNVPVSGPNTAQQLSFWVYEGGSEYTYYGADQQAEVIPSSGPADILFSEQNCYLHPSLGWSPGAASTSGCWPSAYSGDSHGYYDWTGGGFWSPRGPYDLSAYAGQQVTLYVAIWSLYNDTATKYSQFMFLGNVQMTASTSFPTTSPLATKRHMYSMSLKRR